MVTASLYIAGAHLYARAADSEALQLPLGATADAPDPAALAEAAGWLRSRQGRAKDVDLLLSSTRVRFVGVPWVMGTFSGAAIRRQAEQALAATGADPDGWELRIQWPRYGCPVFAVAYPRQLLAGAAEALAAAGLGVRRSLATAVATATRVGPQMPEGPGLLCFAEDDGITGVHLDDGLIADVEWVSHAGSGLDSVDVWCRRKRLEYPGEGQLRWLQPAHCPPPFEGHATSQANGSPSACIDLLEAVA